MIDLPEVIHYERVTKPDFLSLQNARRGTAFTDEERRGLERRAAPTNLQHSEEASGDNTRLGRTCRAEARFDNRKEKK